MDILSRAGYSTSMEDAILNLVSPVALVTGASRGIGRACAEALAQKGFTMALQYKSQGSAVEDLSQTLKTRGIRCQAFQADLSLAGAAQALVEQVNGALGGPVVLIHAAGAILEKPIAFLKTEEWQSQLELHALSALALSKAMLRTIRKSSRGRLVFIGSLAGETGLGNGSAYATSKGTLAGLACCLALETARYSATVNVIAPGYIDTDLTAGADPEKRTAREREIPLGRYGKAEEVAALAAFLCSERSAYLTGQVLTIDGGLNLIS